VFYYRWHIGDYKTATAHLTNEEDLAYRKLLDYYYETEKPIDKPVAWLARRLRIATKDVQSVLSDFFIQEGETWRHPRCDREIAGMEEAIERSRQNGKHGGRPKKPSRFPAGSQQVPTSNPAATCSGYPISPTTPATPLPSFIHSGTAVPAPDDFHPEKEGRKEAIDSLVERLSLSQRRKP
jgi:uncharacterized protein YdaU (DUF1376 family)